MTKSNNNLTYLYSQAKMLELMTLAAKEIIDQDKVGGSLKMIIDTNADISSNLSKRLAKMRGEKKKK